MPHKPVLLEETIRYLAPADGETYVDCTLGFGGHTKAILEQSGPDGLVIAFDWDAEALNAAEMNLADSSNRLTIVRKNFAETREVLTELGVEKVNGLVLDLGLSSMQLDSSGRGFSFKGKEPLDMRMDDRTMATAADIINNEREHRLADIFFNYGEERQSRRIAARIVEERKRTRIESTDSLVEIVAAAVPRRFHPKKIHVATKVFQALRIAVNHELDNLARILDDAAAVLLPGGRLCVITFHSLEDRLTKWKLRNSGDFKVLTKKPVRPGREECLDNPRARSAKLRAAVRL